MKWLFFCFLAVSQLLFSADHEKFLRSTFFKTTQNGTFVTIGEKSNTLLFEKEMGWKGVKIDSLQNSFTDLLTKHNLKSVDYLVIGKEPVDVLNKIDFSQVDIDVIEVKNSNSNVKQLLLSKGFTFIKKSRSDEIYKKPKFTPISSEERPSPRFIQQFLPEKPVVVEAGAHIGNDTALMSKRWKQATIYAFEPSPDVYKKLRKKCAKRSNVKTYALALGDRKGMAEFYESDAAMPTTHGTDAQGSLLPPSEKEWPWKHIGFKKPIRVPVTTLDAWAKSHGVKKVDFLWLDMQGSEFQMLKASPEILKTVKVIQTEVSRMPFYEGTIVLDEGKAWLESQGFIAIYVTPHDHGDALFVRKP